MLPFQDFMACARSNLRNQFIEAQEVEQTCFPNLSNVYGLADTWPPWDRLSNYGHINRAAVGCRWKNTTHRLGTA